MNVCIIGAGALGIQIAHLANKCGFQVVGFFDDTLSQGISVYNIPIIGNIDSIVNYYKQGTFDYLICAIGYKHFNYREYIFNHLCKEKGIPFATLIDKSCIIDSSACIGAGTILYPGCIIDKNVKIGNNVLINLGVCLSHNSSVGDHSYLSPECAIAGNVEIHNRCFLGINSTIVDDIIISSDVIIAAGSVVTKNCENIGLYAGIPAKFKKKEVNFK